MPSSRPDKSARTRGQTGVEPYKINQLGLDFETPPAYSSAPRKEMKNMNQEMIEILEKKIGELVQKYSDLKEENALLNEELQRLSADREGIKSRVDALLGKLDGI